jgi:hypothetical protein
MSTFQVSPGLLADRLPEGDEDRWRDGETPGSRPVGQRQE